MNGQQQTAIDDTNSRSSTDARNLSLARVVGTLQVVLATRRAARAADAAARSRSAGL